MMAVALPLFCIASDDAEQLETQLKRDILLNFICGAEVLSAPPLTPHEDWTLSSNFIFSLSKKNETYSTYDI